MGVESPLIENFLVGPLQMRCSVVTDVQTGDTVIIDGGDEPQRLISWIENCEGNGPNWSNYSKEETQSIQRNVVALLNTHAHFDHSGHIPTLKQHYNVDTYNSLYYDTLTPCHARPQGDLLGRGRAAAALERAGGAGLGRHGAQLEPCGGAPRSPASFRALLPTLPCCRVSSALQC